jgi:hypothetical protein
MKRDIANIVKHYLICALWCSHDENDDSLNENFDLLDISQNLFWASNADVEKFLELAGNMLDDWNDEQIGHDIFLTRCGHGAGFWDRDLPYADELTELVKTNFKEIDIYVTDSGEIDY